MANDVHDPHGDCHSCVQNQAYGMEEKQLNFIFLVRTPEYVGVDILGPLTKTKKGSPFVVIMTDQ